MNNNKPILLDLQKIAEQARELTVQDGYHAPTFIVEGKSGQAVVGTNGFPTEDKHKQLYLLGEQIAAEENMGRLERVVLVSEAWVSIAESPNDNPSVEEVEQTMNCLPSQDPDRVEVLTVASFSPPSGKSTVIIYEMKRDINNNLTDVEAWDESKDTSTMNAQSPLLESFAAGFENEYWERVAKLN